MTGITSTGTNAWKPGVAVNPDVIPYGTVLRIPGYNNGMPVVADDTGGAMRREKDKILIDVRMKYHWEAKLWGRKKLTILVRKQNGNLRKSTCY